MITIILVIEMINTKTEKKSSKGKKIKGSANSRKASTM
jgi:hypothetical protein